MIFLTRKEKKNILGVVIVVCYMLAMISVGKYNLDMITFAKCIKDIIVDMSIVIVNFILIDIM